MKTLDVEHKENGFLKNPCPHGLYPCVGSDLCTECQHFIKLNDNGYNGSSIVCDYPYIRSKRDKRKEVELSDDKKKILKKFFDKICDQKNIDQDIQKILNDNFWELL